MAKPVASSSIVVPSSSSSFVSMSFIPNFGKSEKLDGANYPLWKVKIRSHLVARKLWKHVTGVELKLVEARDGKGRLLMLVNYDELEAWKDRDSHALAMIIGMMVDVVIPHIQMAETSVAWAILKSIRDRQHITDTVTAALALQSGFEGR